MIGNAFITHSEWDLEEYLSKLRNIDWRRSAPQWKLRIIRPDGKIITSNKAIALAAIEIKKEIGLELLPEEEEKERLFLESINI